MALRVCTNESNRHGQPGRFVIHDLAETSAIPVHQIERLWSNYPDSSQSTTDSNEQAIEPSHAEMENARNQRAQDGTQTGKGAGQGTSAAVQDASPLSISLIPATQGFREVPKRDQVATALSERVEETRNRKTDLWLTRRGASFLKDSVMEQRTLCRTDKGVGHSHPTSIISKLPVPKPVITRSRAISDRSS